MTSSEIREFIEEMRYLGEQWTEKEVVFVYGGWSLVDAINDRRKNVDIDKK